MKVDEVDESLISKHCVVKYDNTPYPGIIVDVDEDDLEIKVMHRIGRNRFFWPAMDDVLWYKPSQLITLLDLAPQPVTNRHMKLDDTVWQLIEDEFDDL